MLRLGGQKIPVRTLLLVVYDSGLIFSILVLAMLLRFEDRYSVWAQLNTTFSIRRFVIVLLIFQLVLYYYDLYDFQIVVRRSMLLVRTVTAMGASCLLLGAVYYCVPELSFGRGIAAIAAPAVLIGTFGLRVALDTMPNWRRSERVLVLGTGQSGIELVREILGHRELDMQVAGFLDERGENIGKSLVNPGIIGAVEDVEQIVKERRIDRIAISLAERRGRMPVEKLLHLKFQGVKIEDAHDFYERLTGKILVQYVSPSWLILSDGFKQSSVTLTLKRAIDLFVSMVALLLVWPIMALVALAIWIEDGRPILFRQKRVGRYGCEFEMLKFRSMYTDPARVPSWTREGDSRITRVGQFIRTFRLDELPQFVNVLRGDMSLIGPRPEQPAFVQMLTEQISYYGQRHSVRPGITGWAQVKFRYGASVEDSKSKLEYDLFYIKHLSVPLDFAILFETVKVLLSGRGAK